MRRNRVGGLGWKKLDKVGNCMTVISAWWRSNTPFQKLSGRLNYYIIGEDRNTVSWRQGVVGKATTLQKGPSRPPMEFGGQTHWWQDVVEKTSTQQKAEPRASGWASGERERHNPDGLMSGGKYTAVLFGLQLPLTVKPRVTLFEPFQ